MFDSVDKILKIFKILKYFLGAVMFEIKAPKRLYNIILHSMR